MSNVSRLADRRRRRVRSEPARTLEGIERSMRAHPAGATLARVSSARLKLVPLDTDRDSDPGVGDDVA